MKPAPTWSRIPYELQARAQWLLASPDAKGDFKVPTTVLSDGKLVSGSSTDRSTWLSFDVAAGTAAHYGIGLGYVIAGDDPFVCIDLDVKGEHNLPGQPEKWTTQEELNRYWHITQTFDSYTELSQSGKGLHIWVLGSAAPGAKFGGVEVYSRDRFMVCTGLPVLDKPIADRQQWIDVLVEEIRRNQGAMHKAQTLEDQAETIDDAELWRRASTADNATKFNDLWNGDWVKYGFPSQSEADLALLSMFTFYSRNNEQCRRMFRRSKLGDREKAQKDDRYLDFSLKLIRGRQAHEDAIHAKTIEQAKAMFQSLSAQEVRSYASTLGPTASAPQAADVHTYPAAESSAPTAYADPATAQLTPPPAAVGPETSLDWPPGLAGAIAGFVYRSAPRPVKEVAIVAAIGWLAGVCGKSWNIPGSGLNLYMILVARSAVGKEAMHSGLSMLTARFEREIPGSSQFINFTDFASGPALVKACSDNTCFLNVAGEWGRKLKRIAQDSERDGPMQMLRTVMTNLYQKSGPASIVGGLTYSKKEDNIASVSGVSYSMIGETTPDTLYNSLTESMMDDGFLSRFTIVEYTGERPPANKNPQHEPEPYLVQRCLEIVVRAREKGMNSSAPTPIYRDEEAGAIMDAFDLECDTEINKTKDEAWRQMWNRAHLKMCRIAGLLAVGDNHINPIITAVHVRWAMDLIRRDITIMRRRIEGGDVGSGDGVRERKITMLIKEYFAKPVGLGYKIPDGMRENGIVPRSYIQIRTARLASFTSGRNGATKALDEALRSLCDSGHLMEIDKNKSFEAYGTMGKAYRVLNLPDYDAHHDN